MCHDFITFKIITELFYSYYVISFFTYLLYLVIIRINVIFLLEEFPSLKLIIISLCQLIFFFFFFFLLVQSAVEQIGFLFLVSLSRTCRPAALGSFSDKRSVRYVLYGVNAAEISVSL